MENAREMIDGVPEEEEEEFEEITVDVTEENMVWVHGTDWELMLEPQDARALAEALIDAAKDAEIPNK
jgi:hypothetical protein